jgi:electron transport complex protein RnfE
LLAVSNSVTNALALSLATMVVLLITNTAVSLLRKVVLRSVRLPVYVLIIASTVTILEMLIRSSLPALHASLGIFLPLIVTNCLIIGQAEAFASRHSPGEAAIDAIAMGAGFAWVLVVLGGIREIIGQGTLFADAQQLFGDSASSWALTVFEPDYTILLALLPPGAFIILGLILALKNLISMSSNGSQLIRTPSNSGKTYNT